MMRICVEVKENQSYQPLKLLVDFIRVWYDERALSDRLSTASPDARHYLEAAIAKNTSDGNLRREILVTDTEMLMGQERYAAYLGAETVASLSEAELLVVQAACESDRQDALREIGEALTSESDEVGGDTAETYLARALYYRIQEDREKEIANLTAAIEWDYASPDQGARALVNRGVAYGKSGDHERAINDYTAVIERVNTPSDQVARALFNRGFAYGESGDHEREIDDYTAVIERENAPPDQVAWALYNRGVAYGESGDNERAIDDYTAVIERDNAPPDQVARALYNRGVAYGESGDNETRDRRLHGRHRTGQRVS